MKLYRGSDRRIHVGISEAPRSLVWDRKNSSNPQEAGCLGSADRSGPRCTFQTMVLGDMVILLRVRRKRDIHRGELTLENSQCENTLKPDQLLSHPFAP